jgi:hypothetical protein
MGTGSSSSGGINLDPPCTGVSTLVEEFIPYREEEEDQV